MNLNDAFMQSHHWSMTQQPRPNPGHQVLTGQLRLQRHTASAIVKQFGEEQEEVVCNIAG